VLEEAALRQFRQRHAHEILIVRQVALRRELSGDLLDRSGAISQLPDARGRAVQAM
jgi:hypothetical protein